MNRNFESTRDQNLRSNASEGIIKGLASDGGLFVRRDMESLKVDLASLVGKSYQEIAKIVFGKILDDYTNESIAYCVENAYDDKFSTDEIAPVVKVGDDYVLELFHGPTSAFKDMALSILPYFSTEALKLNNVEEDIIILVATSGDTGKAALEGFKDVDKIKIIVFYPNNGVSKVQEKQMKSQEGKNTFVYAINGNFDDAQSGVKKIFGDKEIEKYLADKKYSLSSANSINIGRLVPQIVYYFASYVNLVKKNEIAMGDKVNFVVPTGNFGNILAGYYAKLMGLPVNKLVCASNENNVLYDFIKTGEYNINRPFHKTISPSMDILISSNLERMIYHMSGSDNSYVKSLMEQLKDKGEYKVSAEVKKAIDEIFVAGYLDDEKTGEIIKKVYEEKGYLLDTHTAIAYGVMEEFKKAEPEYKNIVLSTASPYKFADAVYRSLFGEAYEDEFTTVEELNKKTGVVIPKNLADLRNKKDIHNEVINKEDMKKTLEGAL